MRPLQLLLAALALAVVACSDVADTTSTPPSAGSVGDSETSTTQGADGTAASGTTETPQATEGTTAEPTSDRPLAPDFTLALGDGGSYTLSEGEKPVYLIFWAEW